MMTQVIHVGQISLIAIMHVMEQQKLITAALVIMMFLMIVSRTVLENGAVVPMIKVVAVEYMMNCQPMVVMMNVAQL